jgi:hypothetical protein
MLKEKRGRFLLHMEDKVICSPIPSSCVEQAGMNGCNDPSLDRLEGLLLVEAGIDEDGTVDIYIIRAREMVLVESGGEVFSRAWLGEHAQHLVKWKPRRVHDDLTGIWYKPAQERPPG